MRNKLFAIVSLMMVASMVLAACATPTAAPSTPQTIIQTVEVEVVKTVETIVQGTPMVVTATPPPPAEIKSKDPTTFVFVTYGEPETLDPALDYETSGGSIVMNVYENLITYNKEATNDFVPQLATDWTISDDGMTYTFNIRKGVQFHNGDELTPSDVAYTFQRGLLQGGYASPQWLLAEPFFGVGTDDISLVVESTGTLSDDTEAMKAYDPAALVAACDFVKSVIVADDAAGTVTMQLKQPWAPFMGTIANNWGAIMDQKWVVENGGWDGSCDTWQNFYAITSENDPFTSIMNGTGPFMLDNWTKGQEIDLVRNDNYWRTEPAWEGGPVGPAALERVVIKQVDEWGTRFAMLQAGDADAATVNSDAYVQVDPLVGELCKYDAATDSYSGTCQTTGDGALRLYQGAPAISRQDVFPNFNIKNPEGGNPLIGSGQLDGNGIPPDFFSDVHIRKAFNYCFDWDTYIKDVMAGEGVQSIGISLPGMPGYDPNGPHYTFDLDQCAAEFKAADLDHDGIPAGDDPEGDVWTTGFRFQAAYNTGNTTRQSVAEILAEDVATVNELFQIEIVGLPWATFLRNQRDQTLPLFISGWLEDIHDPHNWYQPYLVGTYGRRQAMPDDINAKLQELVNAGVAATDPAQRGQIYTELNQYVYDQALEIILAIPTARRYEQRWVQGWYRNPIYSGTYYYPISKQ